MPLASSSDPGPPSFSWVLWWAVQKKQHSQQLLPNLNYAVHPNSLTREAGTMAYYGCEYLQQRQHNVLGKCAFFFFLSLWCFMFSSQH